VFSVSWLKTNQMVFWTGRMDWAQMQSERREEACVILDLHKTG